MITCIGNSHANFFTGAHPGTTNSATFSTPFASYSIGPVIAYNFFEHHLPKVYEALKVCKTQKKDKVLLIVGEVDCRWHLPKQINDSKKDTKIVVDECASRFFRALVRLKNDGYEPVVWCGHPSTTEGHRTDPNCPVWGDCKTRNNISRLWRDALVRLAAPYKFTCIDILGDLINAEGLTRMEFFRDYCHLDTPKFLPTVIEKFKKQGLYENL